MPAALGLWSGRSLAPLAADPALPERLMARDRRLGMAIGGTIVTLVWFWPRHAGWTLPLMFVAHLAAGYPLRRVMREETWSIGIYLWFFIRLIVAMFGWWFLLAATPAIVLIAPHPWARNRCDQRA